MSQRWRAEPFPVGPSSLEAIWSARLPDSTAIVDDDQVITTEQLRLEVDRVARCLVGAGLRPGGRVLWLLGNEPASLISLLATIRANGVWVGLDRRATDAERQKIVDDANPALVFATLPVGEDETDLPPVPDPDAVGAIAYTSGTTGKPKGVVHTIQQLLYPAAAAIETEGLDEHSRIGTPLSLATLNILLLGPLTALACGGAAVLLRRSDPAGFAADVKQHQLTRALVVPAIVQAMDDASVDPDDLRSLDRLIMGGSGFDRDRAAASQTSLGVPLIASYGLSEAPTGVARMQVGDAGARALPGIDIRIETDGEITLAPLRTGPWAHCWRGGIAYWGLGVDALWRRGRIPTGDLGTIDSEGFLHVSGRISDMINRGGATISPTEVEGVLLGIDGIDDAAVFGLEDDRLGQRVAAAIVGRLEPDAAREAARQSLSGYKVPESWLVLDEIPRNAGGKVDRPALQALEDRSQGP